MTSALIGASSVAQLENNLDALTGSAAERRGDCDDRAARGPRHRLALALTRYLRVHALPGSFRAPSYLSLGDTAANALH